MGRIVEADKGVFLAADMAPETYGPEFSSVVGQMSGVDGLEGIKLGLSSLLIGLPQLVEEINETDPTLVKVYDHQKAGNDIVDMGENFARVMEVAGVDAAILFPFNGPDVLERWVRELQQRDIGVIVGGKMTHPKQARSEGGYIADESFVEILEAAAGLGVHNFVLPGNKPGPMAELKSVLDGCVPEEELTIWSPGLITQGGDVTETGTIAGRRFNAIVGGAIYKADDPRAAAIELGQKVLALN
jgi:orotidine-5'-phosphate decarboxylase